MVSKVLTVGNVKVVSLSDAINPIRVTDFFPDEKLDEAKSLAEDGNYDEAIDAYLSLIEKDVENARPPCPHPNTRTNAQFRL